MSEPDAVALPREGEVFFDVRGEARSMRLSWYADSAVAVFSIWQGNRCTATFRLPFDDLARMVGTLQSGPPGHAAPAGSRHAAGWSFETSRSDAVYDYLEEPAYESAAAYGEQQAYESQHRYETEHGYLPRYQTESRHGPARQYGGGSDYHYVPERDFRPGQNDLSGHDDRPGGGYVRESSYAPYPHHKDMARQRYRDDLYDARPDADQERTGPSYVPPGYREAPRGHHDQSSRQPDTALYLAAPGYEQDDSDRARRAYRSNAAHPAAAYAQSDRDDTAVSASASAYPGDSGQARFPAAAVTTEYAEPDWDTAPAAYRDR